MFTELIGWVGVGIGISVAIPQFTKSLKNKSTKGLSKRSYQLLCLTIICYLIKAIAVKEPVFIISNSFGLVITSAMLCLFKKYPAQE